MSEPKTAEEIQAMIDEAVAGLKAKNEELLTDNKRLKTDLRKTQEIKPEDFAALESEVESLRAKLTTAEKQVRDATKQAETATKALEAESGYTRKLLVENGLRAELAAAGVTNAVHQKAAMAMLASGVEVTLDGDNRVAQLGGKPLAEAVKEWAAGDEGKHFISAPMNGGGGANGGRGGESGKTMTSADFSALSAKDRAARMAEGYQIADAA